MDKLLSLAPAAAHRLPPGATLRINVQRGSTLFVSRGRILFRTPPYWLADTVLAPCMHLGAEEAQVIEIAGWLEVTALTAAEVRLAPPQPQAGWLAASGRTLLRALRSRWPARLPSARARWRF